MALKTVENPGGPFEYRVGYGGKASSRSGAAGSHGFIKITLSRGSFTCNGVNKVLQWNGTAWQCVTFNIIPVPPTCTGDNSALQWSGSAWSCQAIATPTPETPPACPPTGKTNPVEGAGLIRDASGWGCAYEEYKDVVNVPGTYAVGVINHFSGSHGSPSGGTFTRYSATCTFAIRVYSRNYSFSFGAGSKYNRHSVSSCSLSSSSAGTIAGQNSLERNGFSNVTRNGTSGTFNYTGKAWVPVIDR